MRLTNTQRLLAGVALRVSQEQLDTLLSLSTLPEGVKCRINSPIQFLTTLRQNCGAVADFVQKLEEMLATKTSFADLDAVGRRLYAQCRDEDLSTKVTQSRLPMGLAEFRPRDRQSATFNRTLLQISDCIPQHVLEIMVTVTPIPNGNKGRIRHGHGLFDQMKQCGCISENDTEFLEDLMREVNVVDALRILEGYKKLFPQIEYAPYTPQRPVSRPAHISTPSTPYNRLPTRPAHTHYGAGPGVGVQPESMPELGSPYVVGNRKYVRRSASSNYPSSVSGSNSNSTLGTYPGSIPSNNSNSISNGGGGGGGGGDNGASLLWHLNSIPRSSLPSMAPLNSNRFPWRPESSSDTELRATPASPPCPATPPVHSKNPVHFIKSISSPGSLQPPPISYPPGQSPGSLQLPPISYPPSSSGQSPGSLQLPPISYPPSSSGQSPGSLQLPPISYPPSASGQVGQFGVPRDDIFAGPRVFLPLETTPQSSQHVAAFEHEEGVGSHDLLETTPQSSQQHVAASEHEEGVGSHDPTPSAPSLGPQNQSHDLQAVNGQGSHSPSCHRSGGVAPGSSTPSHREPAAEPWSEAVSVRSQESYTSPGMNSGLAVGEQVSQQPGTGAAGHTAGHTPHPTGHTPHAASHTPHADPRSTESLESYSVINSFPASEEVSHQPRTHAGGHARRHHAGGHARRHHAGGHAHHAASHTPSSTMHRPQSISRPPPSNPQFQPPAPQHLSNPQFQPPAPQHLSNPQFQPPAPQHLPEAVCGGVQEVQSSRQVVTEIGFQANVEPAPSSSIVRVNTGEVINDISPQQSAVQHVSSGNQRGNQNGSVTHWNGNQNGSVTRWNGNGVCGNGSVVYAGLPTPSPVLMKRRISAVGGVSGEFNSINHPATPPVTMTTGKHAHSAKTRPAAAATPPQRRKSKRCRAAAEKQGRERHRNPEPVGRPAHQSQGAEEGVEEEEGHVEEGEGHNLSQSGEKIAQCSDTCPSPVVGGSGPSPVVGGSGRLYPALPAQHDNNSNSSEVEGEEPVSRKRKRPHPQQVSRGARKQRKGWSMQKPFSMVMKFIRGSRGGGTGDDNLTDTGEAENPASACTETDDDEYHSCEEDKEEEEEEEEEEEREED